MKRHLMETHAPESLVQLDHVLLAKGTPVETWHTLHMERQAKEQELQHEIAAPPSSLSTTFGGRRKHQLSGMAMEANQNMALYEAQKLANVKTKKQVNAKYGW